MYHRRWRTSVRAVYKKICNGSPTRDYILTHLYVNWSQLTDAYNGAVDKYVEKMFSDFYWMQVQGEKAMRLSDPPNNDFRDKMTERDL
jgi:hypothetical protein